MQQNKTSNKKLIFSGSLVAAAILGLTAVQGNATPVTTYAHLGSGAEVRNALLGGSNTGNVLELKCGEKKDSTGKAKDAKCGASKASKTKDGKCGEGKCGEGKCGSKKGKKAKKDSTAPAAAKPAAGAK